MGAFDMSKQGKRPAKFICVDCLGSFPFEDMVCVSESDGLLVSVCKKCGKKREGKHV